MLPYRPQTVPTLRARYPQALVRVWEVPASEAEAHRSDRPGLERTYVFDARGIRLIISRDRQSDGRVWLHVSASAFDELKERIARGVVTLSAFDVLVRSQFRSVSGDVRWLQFQGLSGIPHYWLPDPVAAAS